MQLYTPIDYSGNSGRYRLAQLLQQLVTPLDVGDIEFVGVWLYIL
jgi:hypothetical protein